MGGDREELPQRRGPVRVRVAVGVGLVYDDHRVVVRGRTRGRRSFPAESVVVSELLEGHALDVLEVVLAQELLPRAVAQGGRVRSGAPAGAGPVRPGGSTPPPGSVLPRPTPSAIRTPLLRFR